MSERFPAILPPLFMIAFGILLLFIIPQQIAEVSGQGVGPRFFPYVLAFMIISMSVVSLITNTLRDKAVQSMESTEAGKEDKKTGRVILSFTLLVFWAFLNPIIGFVVTTFLLTVALMWTIGSRHLLKMGLYSAIFTFVIYLIAKYLLLLSIPTGILL
ncbi:tripartite tricarboxylate transporter TctB family protein [Sporosarcina sp. 179-K 3D1 HS]|uniref:tripartite tricarboxylate transporter TctB family protein n=1 Tax=Sporosarcina sp. 179-K 3D1 HS TaxID=3232169 RepID=UPI00399FA168